MEFIEQRRDGSKPPVDSGIRATSLILLLHEGDTIKPSDSLWRLGDYFEEDFQVVSITDPRVVCSTHFDQIEEVIDEGSIGRDVSYLAFLPDEGKADNWLDDCAGTHLQISCTAVCSLPYCLEEVMSS
jgi:hypothetical protein